MCGERRLSFVDQQNKLINLLLNRYNKVNCVLIDLPDCVSPSVDCAGIILNCLFCQFYDMILMLPDSCERVASHCCPNYKQVVSAVETTPSSNDDSCMDWDCGLLSSCQDASDCLELAMEISELCYQ